MLDPTFDNCFDNYKQGVTKVKQMFRGICDTIFKVKVMRNFQIFWGNQNWWKKWMRLEAWQQ